jgi:transposase InsO family protein
VERIWRQEGLKVPQTQQKRRRLWLNDTASIRLRPVRKNHVWSYDFEHDRTHDGRAYRILVVIDEFTRECLAIVCARRLSAVRRWLEGLEVAPLYIALGQSMGERIR